jgi:hypothetical protein
VTDRGSAPAVPDPRRWRNWHRWQPGSGQATTTALDLARANGGGDAGGPGPGPAEGRQQRWQSRPRRQCGSRTERLLPRPGFSRHPAALAPAPPAAHDQECRAVAPGNRPSAVDGGAVVAPVLQERLRWAAESAPTRVASGRTGIRAKAAFPTRARKSLYRASPTFALVRPGNNSPSRDRALDCCPERIPGVDFRKALRLISE